MRLAEPGILQGPLRPAVLRLALPAVGTTLFQVLFNITDMFWVGRTLGPSALAAVSLASYSVWVLVSVGELVGVGLTAVAARRHGERDPAAAARAAGTALWMALALSVAMSAGGILALEPGGDGLRHPRHRGPRRGAQDRGDQLHDLHRIR
ncbi:MAG: MATE family efflux transporter, partial [Gemmatimonadales bacterium]